MIEYFRELSATDNLEAIRQALDQKNVSLASEDGFGTELWVRDWTILGYCSLKTTYSTNGDGDDHRFLKRYFRNKFNIYACENYQIYLFP